MTSLTSDLMGAVLDSTPQIVGGAALGLLIFVLGLAVGNHDSNPVRQAFDTQPTPPAIPGENGPPQLYPRLILQAVFCPDCGCSATHHGPDGCTNRHGGIPTCTNTAEDVVNQPTCRLSPELIELFATIEDLLDDAIHEPRCTLVAHPIEHEHTDDCCDCFLGDLRAELRRAVATRTVAS